MSCLVCSSVVCQPSHLCLWYFGSCVATVTGSLSGPRKLFKGVIPAMSGVLARFPLLVPVRNSCASYGASAVARTPDRGHVAEVKKPMSSGWRGLNPGFQRNLSVNDFSYLTILLFCVRSDAVHERQYVKINLIKSLRRCLYKYIRLVRANHFVRVVAFRRTEWVGQTVPAATKAQNRFRRRFEIPLNPKPCVLLCARCRSPSKVHWAADNSGVNA